jgi:ADP-ribose pyrophosphatase YjhB (NUDIX family)
MKNDNPLSQKEFWEIYKKVPRLTVEIIIRKNKMVLLTLRNIEPCKGMWHLPGGTVRFGERLIDAVTRVAARELSITVSATKLLGYIEYPSHFENGLDSPVGIAFEVTNYKGLLKPNAEASKYDWFKELPDNMHPEQKDFIKQNGLI